MKSIILGLVLGTLTSSYAQINLGKTGKNLLNQATKTVNQATGTGTTTSGKGLGTGLSNTQIVDGLKEALSIGTKNSSESASKVDGFFKNPLIKIPFPQEVKMVESTARKAGLGKTADQFVLSLNRAAEGASKEAAPIFLNAITSMSITDALGILNGGNEAATKYLQEKTTTDLKSKFNPVVKTAIEKAYVTKYWNPLITKYNKLPLVQKVNPNLEDYVTTKALEGLFKLVAQEETKIRTNPAARVNDLLKSVFGG